MSVHLHRWVSTSDAVLSDQRCERCGQAWVFRWGHEPPFIGIKRLLAR